MTDDIKALVERLCAVVGDLPPAHHVPLAKEAADALTRLAVARDMWQRERDHVRAILAHTDMGSLPDDWTLAQITEARIDDMMKLREQVKELTAALERRGEAIFGKEGD